LADLLAQLKHYADEQPDQVERFFGPTANRQKP